MGASDSLRQKKINFFCPILDTSTHLQAHLLQQPSESRNESQNTAISDGTFRHWSDDEHIYAS